jgi:hypothetical protein
MISELHSISTGELPAYRYFLHTLATPVQNRENAVWKATNKATYMQCCGTVTIYYGSGSGSDF